MHPLVLHFSLQDSMVIYRVQITTHVAIHPYFQLIREEALNRPHYSKIPDLEDDSPYFSKTHNVPFPLPALLCLNWNLIFSGPAKTILLKIE